MQLCLVYVLPVLWICFHIRGNRSDWLGVGNVDAGITRAGANCHNFHRIRQAAPRSCSTLSSYRPYDGSNLRNGAKSSIALFLVWNSLLETHILPRSNGIKFSELDMKMQDLKTRDLLGMRRAFVVRVV